MGIQNVTIYKKNAKNIPDEIKKESKNIAFNSKVLIQSYEDKKRLLFGANYKDNIENIKNDCNKNNRGVDKMNQQTSCYEIQRKCYKWWKKIFILLVQVSVLNSKIIYEKSNNIKINK